MSEITAITAQTKNKKRASVFIDGEYFCSLDKMTILSNALKVGDSIDSEKLNEIIVDSEARSAFDLAINYLTIRRRTTLEMERYLLGKSYHLLAISNTLAKLTEYGYLNDEEYAKVYVRIYGEKFGKKKLKFELERLGVESSLADKCIEEEGGDEYEACLNAAKKYKKTGRKALDYQKLATFLYGKGFSFDVSKDVIQKLRNEAEIEE